MLRTCPICNRNFESFAVNSVYCNISCRKKAGREKEKEKRSAFFVAPMTGQVELLHSENCPTLERLNELAEMLRIVVVTLQKYRYVNIYGPIPDGWVDGECFLIDAVGANPPCKVMGVNIAVKQAIEKGTVLPAIHGDPRVAMAKVLSDDEAAERQVMSEI